MEKFTRENGLMIKNMAKEHRDFQMVLSTLANTKMVNLMDKGDISGLLVNNTKEVGGMVNAMVTVSGLVLMKILMMENGG